MEEEIQTDKLKSISPLVSQIVLRKLGIYCTERLNVDSYSLMESINLLISDFGEDAIRKTYEDKKIDWDSVRYRLNELNVKIVHCKSFYDPISNKKFASVAGKNKTVDEIESMLQRNFFRYGKKIALMQKELYDIFVHLINESTMQRQQIKSEAFKIIEHQGYRTLEDKKNKSPGASG